VLPFLEFSSSLFPNRPTIGDISEDSYNVVPLTTNCILVVDMTHGPAVCCVYF